VQRILKYFILLYCFILHANGSFCQVLLNDVLASNGSSIVINSEYYISYSVGQLGVIGKYDINGVLIYQGFQKPLLVAINSDSHSQTKISVIVYPNPFMDYLVLKFPPMMNQEFQIIIYDVLGRIVLKETKNQNDCKILIDELTLVKGNYFLELKNINYRFTTQMIKE
jgi:hypothetical protein